MTFIYIPLYLNNCIYGLYTAGLDYRNQRWGNKGQYSILLYACWIVEGSCVAWRNKTKYVQSSYGHEIEPKPESSTINSLTYSNRGKVWKTASFKMGTRRWRMLTLKECHEENQNLRHDISVCFYYARTRAVIGTRKYKRLNTYLIMQGLYEYIWQVYINGDKTK